MVLPQVRDVWKATNTLLNFRDPCGKNHHKGILICRWTYISMLPSVLLLVYILNEDGKYVACPEMLFMSCAI